MGFLKELFWTHFFYYNDLDSVVKQSTIKPLADDELLYAPANTEQEHSALQNNLTAIFNWINRWQLNNIQNYICTNCTYHKTIKTQLQDTSNTYG